MAAAITLARLDKCVVVDVLIAQLSESVTTSLVLNDTTEVVRVCVCRHRTDCDCRAVAPHIADTAVVLGVLHEYYQRLVEIILVYGLSLHRVLVCGLSVRCDVLERILRTELRILHGVDCSHTAVCRHSEYGVDVEVLLVGLVRLDCEVVADSLLYALEVLTLGDITSIEAVAHKHDVYTVAHACLLIYQYIAIRIVVVVLLYGQCVAVILALEQEYHLAGTTIVCCIFWTCQCSACARLECANLGIGHLCHGYGYIHLAYTRRWGNSYPLWRRLYLPSLARWSTHYECCRVSCIERTQLRA